MIISGHLRTKFFGKKKHPLMKIIPLLRQSWPKYIDSPTDLPVSLPLSPSWSMLSDEMTCHSRKIHPPPPLGQCWFVCHLVYFGLYLKLAHGLGLKQAITFLVSNHAQPCKWVIIWPVMANRPTLTKGGEGEGDFANRVNYFGQDCLRRGFFFSILLVYDWHQMWSYFYIECPASDH